MTNLEVARDDLHIRIVVVGKTHALLVVCHNMSSLRLYVSLVKNLTDEDMKPGSEVRSKDTRTTTQY